MRRVATSGRTSLRNPRSDRILTPATPWVSPMPSTVALTGVKKGELLEDVVQRLLRQASSVGIRPRLLLLDRGFYSVAVASGRIEPLV